ncbi:MAG: ribonuclease E Rne [Saliniramus fredricksonii]|uniref:Ribonuclease E n=1 Tax=Saliniramus fredricksonii TaxID=1653334 RepID=A0A0N8KEY9_9HYPH|nr:Rne/Rng family ribonuclease [Saliniramus fredricksonii]KPQ12666.1 MAG: ribonuclease E Rne [Saliniramus fredricksonii]SCC82657.1 RNAse E [Saliniramus fredricksonii]
MANKMLIDASHPEETRVVVVRGQRVEEFDFEAANRKQLRGNIYLAKVTRVEPSLQAAFVEYGGNRHGFLAFSEIHPDYYQIPTADRQALLEDEAAREKEKDKEEEKRPNRRRVKFKAGGNGDDAVSEDTDNDNGSDGQGDSRNDGDDEDSVEQLGGDALEEMPERRNPRRQYKIQEVIKRRQILLVQVVKEERGTKGAALTTYLSLAGRYSVLMPNTARGGGISRKITNADDRKRLKAVAEELEVPDGMGVILRTAGASRTKAEIRRDFDYLMRAWENVREATMSSSAPALVYEEGSLIKRAIRDLYNKDIDEVLVSGDEGYREAKDFMRMLMPSHAKAVKAYKEPTPLFAAFGVEAQLDAMFSSQVSLKSGGYLVINPTEALVSIDVNSGRSTREHNIEDTALKTNLEAADEVARQLRLRDLAGLIVIDFIDMDEKRNNRAVEKRLKDALKSDRARIQIGRISPFGLLEMSRQRMRTGVLESSSVICPTCGGSGYVRATPSIALHVLRSVEEMLIKSAAHDLTIRTDFAVAFYILNQKRGSLRELEERFGVEITVSADETLSSSTPFAVDRGAPASRAGAPRGREAIAAEPVTAAGTIEEADAEEADQETAPRETGSEDEGGDAGTRRRRRRRRRRGRSGENGEAYAQNGDGRNGDEDDADEEEGQAHDDQADDDRDASETSAHTSARSEEAEDQGEAEGRRRRGRRGGRRNRRGPDDAVSRSDAANDDGRQDGAEQDAQADDGDVVHVPISEGNAPDEAAPEQTGDAAAAQPEAPEEPKSAPRRRTRRKAAKPATTEPDSVAEGDGTQEPASAEAEEGEAKPRKKRAPAKRAGTRRKAAKPDDTAVAEAPAEGDTAEPVAAAPESEPETTSPAGDSGDGVALQPEAAGNGDAAQVETPEEEQAPTPPPEPVTVVLTPPDPERPKRAGWWSKAKTIITGQD